MAVSEKVLRDVEDTAWHEFLEVRGQHGDSPRTDRALARFVGLMLFERNTAYLLIWIAHYLDRAWDAGHRHGLREGEPDGQEA